MEMKRRDLNNLFLILMCAALAGIFYKASGSAHNAEGKLFGLNFNLVVYIGSLAAAFIGWLIVTIVSDVILTKKPLPETDEPSPIRVFANILLYALYTLTAGTVLLFIYKIYTNETNLYAGDVAKTYIRQLVPHRIYFVFIFAVAAILFFTISRRDETPDRMPRVGLAIVFSLANALATWCPNMFADQGGGVPHIHAVTNSIVNVARFVPYSPTNNSIYGHFGLIFLPFVKLFGDNLTAIHLTICLFTFIAFLSAFYVAHKLIRKNAVYVLTLIGITGTTTILTRRGQYLQINPLRLLFPMLMLAVITYGAYHNEKKSTKILTIVLEVIVGMLGVVWNFETGLFGACVCACVIILRSLYKGKLFSSRMWIGVAAAFFYGALSLAGGYGIVQIYNKLTGGGIVGIREYIYPLMSKSYHVNDLRVPLPSIQFLYFFQLLLFLVTVLLILRRQHVEAEADERSAIVMFAISLSGLSSIIYFMNRAAYGNMSITHIQMVLLLAAYGQAAVSISRENIRDMLKKPAAYLSGLLSIVLFGGLVWMAIEGGLYLGICYNNRANNDPNKSSWNTATMDQAIEEIKAEFPHDCYGFGSCTPEIWYQMGWKNIIYMTDWSDMNDLNREYLRGLLEDMNMVVCSNDNFPVSGWHIVKEVSLHPYTFHLYVRDGYSWDGKSTEAKADPQEPVVESQAESIAESVPEEVPAGTDSTPGKVDVTAKADSTASKADEAAKADSTASKADEAAKAAKADSTVSKADEAAKSDVSDAPTGAAGEANAEAQAGTDAGEAAPETAESAEKNTFTIGHKVIGKAE